MHYTPITPFRRSVDAAQVARLGLVEDKSTAEFCRQPVNKWELLKQLSTAKRSYNLTDRDLSVLQALLSFHPEVLLGQTGKPLVVYPSNASICERLNGMPCSTMRRHLAKLIAAGLLIRRDSPNGKRYSKSFMGEKICFGFDLSPLLTRQREFADEAAKVTAQEEALHHQRQSLSLMRRDIFALIAYGRENAIRADWDAFHATAVESGNPLKRRLGHSQLCELLAQAETLLTDIKALLVMPVPEEMSTNATQIEQHYQKTIKEIDSSAVDRLDCTAMKTDRAQPLPLEPLLEALSEIQTFAAVKIKDWRSLINTAEIIRPMMGLSQASWNTAVATFGLSKAAITIAAMLERIGDIPSPSAYLVKLCTDNGNKGLSIGQWVNVVSGRFQSSKRLSSQL